MGQQSGQQLGQIDRQALAAEVERAHAARTQAEDACCEARNCCGRCAIRELGSRPGGGWRSSPVRMNRFHRRCRTDWRLAQTLRCHAGESRR